MSCLVAENLAMPGRLLPVSFEVGAGQLVGLVGPNGSGKTSLLQALAGIPPGAGQVSIAGQQTKSMSPATRQKFFSFLPASRDVIWPLTARSFIDLALPPNCDWDALAGRLELAALLDRRMDRLSTGERTRVMIARALAPDPLLLLLDEPIANLDPYWQLTVLQELRDRVEQSGRSAIVAIHDLAAALRFSDRIILMDESSVAADGTPAKLRASGEIEKIFRVSPDWAASLTSAGRQSSR